MEFDDRRLPLFHRDDGRPVLLGDWNEAVRATHQADDHRLRRLGEGVDDLARLHADAQAEIPSLQALLAEIRDAISAWQGVIANMDGRFPFGGSGIRSVADALRQLEGVVHGALGPLALVGAERWHAGRAAASRGA